MTRETKTRSHWLVVGALSEKLIGKNTPAVMSDAEEIALSSSARSLAPESGRALMPIRKCHDSSASDDYAYLVEWRGRSLDGETNDSDKRWIRLSLRDLSQLKNAPAISGLGQGSYFFYVARFSTKASSERAS
jgi:hypothetical protein